MSAQRARRAAAVGTALAAAGTVLGLFTWWDLPTRALVPMGVVALVVDALVFAILWSQRRSPSTSVASLLLLCSQVPFAILAWVADAGRAAQGVYWVPYEANKMAILAIALVAPPRLWVGLAAEALYLGTALVHDALFAPHVHQKMAAGEPWATLGYSVIGVVLLVFRLRGNATHDEVVRLRAEEALRKEAAGVFFAIRDLANTPLQTLEVSVQLLARNTDPDVVRVTGWIQRSVQRLRRLNQLLDTASVGANRHEGEASIDSADRLATWTARPRATRSDTSHPPA
ncbi:MAG: hypothetical protein ACXWVM_18350 [Polyangiales bacterium]